MQARIVTWVSLAAALAVATGSRPAYAEDATLHTGQAHALLGYAEAELEVLNGILAAKEFDPELTKAVMQEVERALSGAKRSVDRARILADDAKLEGEFTKVLEAVKRAEKQHGTLQGDIQAQTGVEEKPEAQDHREDLEAEKEQGEERRDWNLLKTGVAWLYVDVREAKAANGALSKKLKGTSPKAPAKPAGKREK